jgi:hypothetical protein
MARAGTPARVERQLTRGETTFWYGFAAVTYVAASIVEKSLLNWFVGPLWLIAVVWFGPLLVDVVRGGSRGRESRPIRHPSEPPE